MIERDIIKSWRSWRAQSHQKRARQLTDDAKKRREEKKPAEKK